MVISAIPFQVEKLLPKLLNVGNIAASINHSKYTTCNKKNLHLLSYYF